VWSCYVHDDPQPVLDYEPAPTNPTNPNGVAVGDKVTVTANGSLNGRDAPSSAGAVVKTRPHGDTFTVTALENGWAAE